MKCLILEARKQQEGVDVLLDRGHRYLAVRANIVLEVDLENLVFLWNTYVDNLQKLYSARLISTTGKQDNSEPNDGKVLNVSVSSGKVLLKEDVSVELKDQDSHSGGSCGSSVDVSQEFSFHDAGVLTLEDLKTTTSALHISELIHDSSAAKFPTQSADSCLHSLYDEFQTGAKENDEHETFNTSVGHTSQNKSFPCHSEIYPVSMDSMPSSTTPDEVCFDEAVMMSNCGDAMDINSLKITSQSDSPSLVQTEKEDSVCKTAREEILNKSVGDSFVFDSPFKHVGESFSTTPDVRLKHALLDAPGFSNRTSRSESPISLDSSRSETPTGTLKRAERQNELWRAIGSIDTFLMDKDILEACKSTAGDLTAEDEDCAGAPNVSFAEFLQQYRELTDWLNQVHKVTQREVTSLSEKYINERYQEELLERSPRREFLNNYSRQLLLRYPGLADQIEARMARLNAQWAALETAVAPTHGSHDADRMLRDLESDLYTLRRWLNTIEARLLSLAIKPDSTDADIKERLVKHKALQGDIESHNKIVNAVLKLSERLSSSGSGSPERTASDACNQGAAAKSQDLKEERERESLQFVALNLQRRWHGIWLQSLECQCRLEEALTRRKGLYQGGFDFGYNALPVLDESLFGESSQHVSEQGLIELDDDSLLFVGRRNDDYADYGDTSYTSYEEDLNDGAARSDSGSQSPILYARPRSESPEIALECDDDGLQLEEFGPLWSPLVSDSEDNDSLVLIKSEGEAENISGTVTPVGPSSPPRPIQPCKLSIDSPLGKRPYPDQTSGEASPAKRGSQSPLSSSGGGTSPVWQENPLENFISSRGLDIPHYNTHNLKTTRNLFENRSSGDSANISENESKMGDSPPVSIVNSASAGNGMMGFRVGGGGAATSSEGEGRDSPQGVRPQRIKGEVKDIGYSSESQSNDEIEMMRHQIDLECKFPGKCEVASDGPLGDKVMFPSVGVRPDYYCMTIVELDSTTASDVATDSSGERSGKEAQPGDDSKKQNDSLDSLSDSISQGQFGGNITSPMVDVDLATVSSAYGNGAATKSDFHMTPMHQLVDFSESDSAPEGGKKSVRYLIDHAEDLVKSPHSSIPGGSPKKIAIILQPAQTQTDSPSTVESSCDASGEDNSDHEQVTLVTSTVVGDTELSATATDDAEDTLYNSVINMESVSTPDPSLASNTFSVATAHPSLSGAYDQARLRKQTGDGNSRHRRRRDKKDRPWSVVGLQESIISNSSAKFDLGAFPQPSIAASESAINKAHHFHTDSDSSSPTHHPLFSPPWSLSSTFPRDHVTVSRTPVDYNLSSSRSTRRKLKFTSEAPHHSSSTLNKPALKSSSASHCQASSGTEHTHGQRSPSHKARRPRRLRRKSSLEGSRVSAASNHRSSATDSYDSAEADTESETTDEYLTAPMEAPTSEGDDVHNVSGSLSENSTWDNYQMVYPTASEDAGEELLAWEPHDDDLEFDDDFQLGRGRSRSVIKDVLGETGHSQHGQKAKSRLKFTKAGVPCEDSDSDLEDFHHILGQSELQLRLVDQSLRKRRKDPMGTGLHPNPAKYSEMLVTYETNIRCLETICQHLNSEDVTVDDVKRVKDLMYQWEKVYALASERHTQTTALLDIRNKMVDMKTCLQETSKLISFNKFNTADDLNSTILRLKGKFSTLETQGKEIENLRQKLTDFSSLHPTICVDFYLHELTSLQKSTASTAFMVKEHTNSLDGQRGLWLEYLDSQRELDILLAADRDRLHQLLGHRESGLRVTKGAVLAELETLRSSLEVYESKLAVLGAMRARLTQSSDVDAQKSLLASLADLRNQLLVVSQRCKQMYRDIEDDEDLPLPVTDTLGSDSDLGKLAISAATLHEVFNQSRRGSLEEESSVTAAAEALLASPGGATTTTASTSEDAAGLNSTCAAALRSLPVQVVALVLMAGLTYALDPEILDRLTSFTLAVTPELNYVNGPPPL